MTLAEFRTLYPEFDSTVDAQVQAFLDLFLVIYQGDYGDLADHMQGLFAAHRLTIKGRGKAGATGALTGKSVGDASWSYGSGGSDMAMSTELGSTNYGLELAELLPLFADSLVAEPYRG